MRLDREIVRRKLASTRSRAHFLIKSKAVKVNRKLELKPAKNINIEDEISLDFTFNPWVSRGGLKLDHLFKSLSLKKLKGKALDIGSSTGGFTEVLLYYGVEMVYSIDVGKNQMNHLLRKNKKIVLYEELNVKNMNNYDFPKFDIIVCDVSFISLKKVIKPNIKFLKTKGWLISLIKPQFEIGKDLLGKGGIVKNVEHHQMVLDDITNFFENEINLNVKGIIESPILGPKGNKEFLIYVQN